MTDDLPQHLQPVPDDVRCPYQPGGARCVRAAGHQPPNAHIRVLAAADEHDIERNTP